MACPFFEPRRKLDAGPWTHAPRLPLGAAYAGICRAHPAGAQEPTEEHQRELCNCGYARGRCSEFPLDAEGDAVRFSVAGESVMYILEKDHTPVRHGVLEMDDVDELLRSQGRAFLENQR
ncbi:MAG TPA: hypothetical protein VGN17_25700 [Bryobacteraceae bacterium]|jgi:hypothetical protein